MCPVPAPFLECVPLGGAGGAGCGGPSASELGVGECDLGVAGGSRRQAMSALVEELRAPGSHPAPTPWHLAGRGWAAVRGRVFSRGDLPAAHPGSGTRFPGPVPLPRRAQGLPSTPASLRVRCFVTAPLFYFPVKLHYYFNVCCPF